MHVLDKSDAIQLYCYLIYTFENISLKSHSSKKLDVEDERFIIHCFENYKTKENNKAISHIITGYVNSKQLYNFGLKIRQLRSLSISNKEWSTYKKYLNDKGKTAIGAQKIEKFIKSITDTFAHIPNPNLSRFREYDFAHTNWWVYYYDMLNEDTGITRAVLCFDEFCRLSMYNLTHKNSMYQTYDGTFKVYNDVHLVARLRSKNLENRFLEMNFYIGNNLAPTFCLGIYTIMTARIASGYIIMKRVESKELTVDELKAQVKFYPSKIAAANLGAPIVTFLSKKSRNRLELPDEVVDEEGLEGLE